MSARRPVMLMVLDGVGLNPRKQANALALARTPVLDRLMVDYPFTTLEASGEAVGLMPGQMGDSNVGHLNLGAGRIVYQELVRIHRAIASGELALRPALRHVLDAARQPGQALHLMGLLSDGGVHSHIDHLFALLDAAAGAGVRRIWVHAFLDGRDVPPTSAGRYLEALESKLASLRALRNAQAEVGAEHGAGSATGNGGIEARLATVSGRYYAMDRDRRWERIEKAHRAIDSGLAPSWPDWRTGLEAAYARGETDEFVTPFVVGPHENQGGSMSEAPGAPAYPGLQSGDGVIFFNYRADRARQLTRALTQPDFDGFPRPRGLVPVAFAGMALYDETFGLPRIFAPEYLRRTLGEVVAEAGLRQLRIAETEKYAHVTFFFSGGDDRVFPGEDRVLIPSPKVATYDQKPEMSAFEVAEEAVRRIQSGAYDLIVLNFANGDMVGHTGDLTAAVRAVEAVDQAAGRVLDAVREAGGAALVLADHGNCDQMIDYRTGEPHTNHTTYPVPCILVDERRRDALLRKGGVLADAAPTLLELLGLPQPAEMDRRSLIAAPEQSGETYPR